MTVLVSGSAGSASDKWKDPVATQSLLPTANNNEGDARVILDTNYIAIFKSGQWVINEGSKLKEPVATFADLPATGNTEGDMRVTSSDLKTYMWHNGSWNLTTSQSKLKDPVSSVASLPATGNEDGDTRVTTDTFSTYMWYNGQWNATGSASSGSLTQITKLGVTGSSGSPYVVDVGIKDTADFNLPPIEVLKFTPGSQNLVNTVCNFDNADATSFIPDPAGQVLFDGKMHLQTTFTSPMVNEGVLGSGVLFSAPIDPSKYKNIEKVEVI